MPAPATPATSRSRCGESPSRRKRDTERSRRCSRSVACATMTVASRRSRRGHRDGAPSVLRQPRLRVRVAERDERFAAVRHRGQVVAARRRDERRALDLGRLDVVRQILRRVDVDVGVVAQVDRRDPEAAFLVDPVVAAALVGRDVGPERVLRPFQVADRAARVALAGAAERAVDHVAAEHLLHVVGHRRDRPRASASRGGSTW